MDITNKVTIDEWSEFTDEDLRNFGDDGDQARKTLLDPVIFDLSGGLKDKVVLDAGCGNGYLARKLAANEAIVTAIEPAENLYQYCLKRERQKPLNIEYMQQDLADLGTSDKYDVVYLINVLMDIPDYKIALQNCIQALKPEGMLVVSLLHPAFPGFEADWQRLGYVKIDEYFKAKPVKQKYGHLFKRPLQDYLNLLIDSGCVIKRVVEPQLVHDNGGRNAHVPQFLVIQAVKA